MEKITSLSLYIINTVKVKRLVFGISTRNLSEQIDHSTGYVGMVESENTQTQYPPHEWPKLAEVLKCEVHDLLPTEESTSTGELVEKKVIDLAIEKDARQVIAALKDHGFFDDEKTHEEVLKHLNVLDEEQIKVIKIILNSL